MTVPTQVLKISEIAADQQYAVVGGPFGSKLGRKDYIASGVPVLRGSNLPFDKRIDLTDLVFVSAEKVEKDLSGNLANPGDIIVTQRGTLGQVGLLPTDSVFDRFVVSQSQMKLTVNFTKADARFIYYYLKSPATTKRIIDRGSSSGVPHINLETFRNFEIELPKLEVQRCVAGILTLFDDLIENNRRRIEILEEMARLLYRERFVHFRFPGYEDTELVDSDLGPIPEGWGVSRVCDVLETIGGGTPSKEVEEYWTEGNVQWFTPTDLTRAGSAFAFRSKLGITELGLKKSSAKLFPPGSVMMTSRATIGVVSISTTEATTNQGFITCVPSERLPSSYIYFWLHANIDQFLSLSGGATFKELRKSTFRELQILVPSRPEMNRFEERVGPMMALVKNLLQQNRALLEARDLLLPRLVSGEMDVSELDLGLERVGA